MYSPKFTPEWYLAVARGRVIGHRLIHKFGAGELTTTMNPVTASGFYRTPQAPVALELVSDDATDTASGVGARQVKVIYLDGNGQEQIQYVSTNGLTPVPLTNPVLRMSRWGVSVSGTYATSTDGSHVGTLTLQEVGGGDVWSVITPAPFPVGQSQIGVYSVPESEECYLISKNIFVDSTKSADLYFFKRDKILETVAPYEGTMNLLEREVGVSGGYDLTTRAPKFMASGPCDVGFMGKIAIGTADCSVEFELLLVEKGSN